MATKKKQIDAITLLKTDHKKVRALLETLDQTKAAARRTKLLGQIETEIKAHARIEEEIFYPAFKAKAEESEQLETYYEAQEEHGLVDIILPKAKDSDPATEEFGARAKVLMDLVVHHAKEEEKEMFKQARELFDRGELQSLGAQMERRRRQIVRELKSGG